MTFILTFKALNPPRTLTVKIAGCVDEADAEAKLRTLYNVQKVTKNLPLPCKASVGCT